MGQSTLRLSIRSALLLAGAFAAAGATAETRVEPRIGVTVLLVVYTAVLIAVFGIGSGILAATRGPRADRAVLIGTSIS